MTSLPHPPSVGPEPATVAAPPSGPDPLDPVAVAWHARLVAATMKDDAPALQALLDEGMDPYAARPLSSMDLMSTVIGRRQTNPNLRKLVMGQGLNLDPTRMGTPGVHTPWHIASRWRDTTALRAMVKLCDRHGKTPNLNDQDRTGNTPLGLALLRPIAVKKPAFDKVHASVQVLLDAGANVNAIDPVEQLPLYFEMLRRHSFLFKDQRSTMDHYTMLPLFLKHGLDPNARDGKGNTLLHLLADKSAPMGDLILAGAHLDLLNNEGKSVWDLLPDTRLPAIRQAVVIQERRLLTEVAGATLDTQDRPTPVRAPRSRL